MSANSPGQAPPAGGDSRAMLSWAVSGRNFGTGAEPLPGEDAAVAVLLALLLFCLGCVAATVRGLTRRSRTSPRPEQPPSPPGSGRESAHPAPRPAWQRAEDWWKA